MRFEHGSHRYECLAALTVLLLLLLCCRSAAAAFRTFRQCLYLDEDVGPWDACGPHSEHVRLRFCDAYEVARLLPNNSCDSQVLGRLRLLDRQASQEACRFKQLLDRYDCDNNSVTWTCNDCQEAYKQWVCAMFLPQVRMEGEGARPCRYICRLVEQRCPYFHPSVKDQYAGERVFKCIDPDIPDLESFQDAWSYGPPNRCYCPQHLGGQPQKDSSGEAECRFLTPAQLRWNASRRGGSRSRCCTHRPVLVWTLLAALMAAWWTRTR